MRRTCAARARRSCARGGAASSNVFTRSLLALFGIVPWRAVPVMPVEIMLLPRWFPFHLDKISYWAPHRARAAAGADGAEAAGAQPKGVRIDELFLTPPATLGPRRRRRSRIASWFCFFRALDACCCASSRSSRSGCAQRAIDAAVAFVTERLNGEDGLGAIFPAMANSVMMFDALGYSGTNDPRRAHRARVDREAAGRQ